MDRMTGPEPNRTNHVNEAGQRSGISAGLARRIPLNFDEIHQTHRARVYSLCLRMVKNTSDAEDLTQEVFLQVFRKMGTFRGESAFSTWLHRVAVNVVLMNTRRRKHYVEVPIEPQRDEETAHPAPELEVADLNLAGATDRVDLQRAIAQLPDGCRRALLLYEVQGYRHMEIARLLRTSRGNSKSQLRRARMRMRGLLTDGAARKTRRTRARARRAWARQASKPRPGEMASQTAGAAPKVAD